MIEIKRLHECTLDDVVATWNSGFRDYYVDVTTTVDKFIRRMCQEDLSAAMSVVAWVDGKPAGLVMTGVRTIGGQTVSWNGGTCVVPEQRGKGVGAAMMSAVFELYRQAGVERTVLEAFAQNGRAISLYRSVGYQTVDRLLFLQRTGPFAAPPFTPVGHQRYTVRSARPHEVGQLPFYRNSAPWQTQWQSNQNGEGLLVLAPSGRAVGYALYQRVVDQSGALQKINLLQCEVLPELEDADDVLRLMLAELYAPHAVNCLRGTFNFPATCQRVVQLLTQEGFKLTVEQVYMEKQMDKSSPSSYY